MCPLLRRYKACVQILEQYCPNILKTKSPRIVMGQMGYRRRKKRGAKPKYKNHHLLLTLLLIDKYKSIGRYVLSEYLMLSEASTRSVLERLNDAGITHSPGQSSGRRGNWLSTFGIELAEKIKQHVELVEVMIEDIFATEMQGILIRGSAKRIRDGIKQRDDAIRAGASGAITLVHKDGNWIFPNTHDPVPVQGIENPQEDDVLIVAFQEDKTSSLVGAIGAGYILIHRPTLVYFEGKVQQEIKYSE